LAPTKAAPQTKQQGQQARHTKGQKGGPSDPSAPSKGGSMVVKASAKALSFNPIKQQHHAQQSQFNSEQRKSPRKERGSERVGGKRHGYLATQDDADHAVDHQQTKQRFKRTGDSKPEVVATHETHACE
jgi:hypothetical protein